MQTNSIADTLPLSTKKVSHKRWANSLQEDLILVLRFWVNDLEAVSSQHEGLVSNHERADDILYAWC